MELHSEVLSATIISEIINQIIENAFDNSNKEETSELISTSSDKENQSTPEDDEVVENEAINEFTSNSKEMIDGERKNEIPSSSEKEFQSDNENQSNPDEGEEVVENDTVNEFTSISKEMIDDEGKNEIPSSSEKELQSDNENQSNPDEDEEVVENEAINEFTSNSKEMIDDERKNEIPSSSEEEFQSDNENQSNPDEDEEVVENDAVNEFTSISIEMIDDEGKNEIPSSSEKELQSDNENQSNLDEDEEVVENEAINEFTSNSKEMIDGERKNEIPSSSEKEFQSDNENQSNPDEDEEVVENDAVNEFTSISIEMIDDEGKNEIPSSSEKELQSDNENQSNPDEDEEVVENDAVNEFTSISKEMIDDQGKNEIPSSSEEETQLIDHVENVNGKAISGVGGCEVLKVNNQDNNDGKDDVFQKIEKSTDIALGDINSAAVDDINNSLYCPSGTESNAITGDARVLAKNGTNEGDEFYNNQLLRSKGFSLKLFERTRVLTNLSLYVSTIDSDMNCEVFCTNLPYYMMENHLIPLFEKAGKVCQLRMVLYKENRDKVVHVYVTYTKKEDAEKAIQILNHRKVDTQIIRVVKHTTRHQIFVKGIPNWATKPQLFDKFNYLTTGLENVVLFDSLENAGKNRGFCFLDYVSYQEALDAKRFISKNKIYGRQLFTDWTQRQMEKDKDANESTTLHISNLHLNLHSSDLRKLFSVYGEVCEIDKTSNYADVVFRNPEDAQRAAREINKKLLGNDNVEIWLKLKQKSKLPQKFKLPEKFEKKSRIQKRRASRKKTGNVTTSPRK